MFNNGLQFQKNDLVSSHSIYGHLSRVWNEIDIGHVETKTHPNNGEV